MMSQSISVAHEMGEIVNGRLASPTGGSVEKSRAPIRAWSCAKIVSHLPGSCS